LKLQKEACKRKSSGNPKYFTGFRKEVKDKKILSTERRAKNILINLSGGRTILVHMKMTGHLLYGKYEFLKKENKWAPVLKKGPLADPYNRFVHVVFALSNGKHLAFSDTRKFGKITLQKTAEIHTGKHLNGIGPEPLQKSFDLKVFKQRLLKKPNGEIKTVLMDQTVIAGIGNIYSDEILWRAGAHPERKVQTITEQEFQKMFLAMKKTLKKGISLGGDSMSDYRNVYGKRGKFQLHHEAYRRTGEPCRMKGCKGKIARKIVGGRSAHFCSVHQK
jgi:formamidopyrimidine-DNA glycosylase